MRKESELIGYVVVLEPIVKRRLLGYRIKLMTLSSKLETIYLREIPTWLRLGIPIKAKVISSIQTGEKKWVVEKIDIARELPWFSPEESMIEDISGERIIVITGKRRGRFFSLPVTDEEILEKIPKPLPSKVRCLFLEISDGTKLASIIPEKEYRIIKRAEELARAINEQEKKSEKILREMLEEIHQHSQEFQKNRKTH